MQKIIQDRNKKLLVDISANRITLLDGRFYYTDEKEPKPIPSVTTILSAYPKDYGYYEWIKKLGETSTELFHEAGRRGSRVHDMTERYDKGEKVSLMDESQSVAEMRMEEWAMFERYVDFTTRFQPEHELIEQNIVSTKLNAAGTIDRRSVVKFFGTSKLIIDIKTSPTIYDYFWIQGAAYREMHRLEFGQDCQFAVLHLNAKVRTENPKECQGIGWKLYLRDPAKHQEDFDIFKATQKLWYAQNGAMVPNNIVYQSSHQKAKIKTIKKK